MGNNTVGYLQPLQKWLDDCTNTIDGAIFKNNTGEQDSLSEAKLLVLERVNGMIEDLQRIKLDIETLPVKKFHEKHLIK